MQGKDTFLFRMEESFSFIWETFRHILCMCFSNFIFFVYCNSEHFKIFSNWNSKVFAMELGLSLGLSHYDCLVLGSVSPHAVFLIPLIDLGKICIKVTRDLQRCLAFKRCSASSLNCRYLNPNIKLKLIVLTIKPDQEF